MVGGRTRGAPPPGHPLPQGLLRSRCGPAGPAGSRVRAPARRCVMRYNKRLVGSSLRSVANQLFLSSSSQQQRYSLMAVKNHRATQQAC